MHKTFMILVNCVLVGVDVLSSGFVGGVLTSEESDILL